MMQTLEQLKSGQLKGIKELKLSCELTKFPKEIIELADTLEVLDLSNNQLSELPDDFKKLKKLKIAFFSNNLFKVLPSVLYDCESLTMIAFKSNQIHTIPEKSLPPTTRWLILTNNQIEKLPDSIGECKHLQKAAFAGNKIQELPPLMASCRKLELLRISANQLKQLPNWLLQLPRLGWLAFSGNPCSFQSKFQDELEEIHFSKLELKETLGEGASGIISKAIYTHAAVEEVAVKIFKGEVTSDGFPKDEMATFIAAGKHPNLVPLKGKIVGHDECREGLILELIPSSYKVLGNPPSMDSCTRDVFNPDLKYEISEIISILSGVASAVKHLHDKGILHGDLYAHNTLVNKQANLYFGDFGAATFYNTEEKPIADLLERIEVRAFGCLMEDLIELVIDKDTREIKQLIKLKDSCFDENVLERKNFSEIQKCIEEI